MSSSRLLILSRPLCSLLAVLLLTGQVTHTLAETRTPESLSSIISTTPFPPTTLSLGTTGLPYIPSPPYLPCTSNETARLITLVGICTTQPKSCCITRSAELAQAVLCLRGGCCARVAMADGPAVLAHEPLAPADACNASLVAAPECARCAVAESTPGVGKTCEAGFEMPPWQEPFTGDIVCGAQEDSEADATPEAEATMEVDASGEDTKPTNGKVGRASLADAKGVVNEQQANCFPRDATVERRDNAIVSMAELKIGDEVHVGNGEFSPVYTFTHRLPSAGVTLIVLHTDCGRRLSLTGGHYVRVGKYGDMRTAQAVRVGDDLVLGSGLLTRVASVEVARGEGLFNPQTIHGEIVVNGVVASCYTTAMDPVLGHAALAPLRALFRIFALPEAAVLKSGAPDWVLRLVPKGNYVSV